MRIKVGHKMFGVLPSVFEIIMLMPYKDFFNPNYSQQKVFGHRDILDL